MNSSLPPWTTTLAPARTNSRAAARVALPFSFLFFLLAGGASCGAPPLVPSSAEQLLEQVRRPGARAVVLNAWATWCGPCREEMPELLRLYRELEPRGMRLLLVSADFPEATNDARRFLRRVGVDFPTYLKTGEDMAFIEALEPSWSGALPATFVYDGAGRLRHVWTGKTTYEELKRVVLEVFESSAGPTKEGS